MPSGRQGDCEMAVNWMNSRVVIRIVSFFMGTSCFYSEFGYDKTESLIFWI